MNTTEKNRTIEENPKVQRHMDICLELNETYAKKNHDYGDSFHETWKEEAYAMARIRLSDKLNRFKKLSRNAAEEMRVSDESMRDTLLDLANYAIMTVSVNIARHTCQKTLLTAANSYARIAATS